MKKLILLIFLPEILLGQIIWDRTYNPNPYTNYVHGVIQLGNRDNKQLVAGFSYGDINGNYGNQITYSNISSYKSRVYKLNSWDGSEIDSSNIFYGLPLFKNYLAFADTSFFATNCSTLFKFYNNLNYKLYSFDPQIWDVIGKPNIDNNNLQLICRNLQTLDFYLFRFTTDLEKIDSLLIPYSNIIQIGNQHFPSQNHFYGNDHGVLFHNPKNNHYWFSNHNWQYILDSSLKCIDIKLLHHKSILGTLPGGNSYVVNGYSSQSQLQLKNFKIIALSSHNRYYFSGPKMGSYDYYLRLTKWNEDFEIEDSLEFSIDQDFATECFISNHSLSFKEKPHEIYVAYTVDRAAPFNSNLHPQGCYAVVTKLDSSLNIHWTQIIKHPDYKFICKGIEALEEGGAIIYGGIFRNPTNPPNPIFAAGYIIRIDSSGAITSTSDPLMQIEKDYVMYPNPAKDYVWFQAQKPYQTISIKIYDIHGKLVYQKEDVQEEQINISEWSKGMYLYQIECEGRISSGKIIKE